MIESVALGAIGANCYIITDDESGDIAVIDPGAYNNRLSAQLESRLGRVRLIMLTHGHFDHLLGVVRLAELCPAAQICIHEADVLGLSDGEFSRAAYFTHQKQTPVQPHRLLRDDDCVALADTAFTVVYTPGHTPGSVCYLWKAGGQDAALFSGDTLFAGNIGRCDFPGGDMAAMRRSLARLAALGDAAVYPGHGESTTLAHEREHNPWMC